jgi:hypothetical protein
VSIEDQLDLLRRQAALQGAAVRRSFRILVTIDAQRQYLAIDVAQFIRGVNNLSQHPFLQFHTVTRGLWFLWNKLNK